MPAPLACRHNADGQAAEPCLNQLQAAVLVNHMDAIHRSCTRVLTCSPLLAGLFTRSCCCSLRPLALPLTLPGRIPRPGAAVPAATDAWVCRPTAAVPVSRARAHNRAAKAETLASPTLDAPVGPGGTAGNAMATTGGTQTPGHRASSHRTPFGAAPRGCVLSTLSSCSC